MSTRSVTVIDTIIDEYDWDAKADRSVRQHIARFYRHCDGYPEGHGLQMAVALAAVSMQGGSNNRNWMQPFLGVLCGMDLDIEFEPTSAALGAWAHGDLDYSYRVTGRADYTGGKLDDPDSADSVEIEVFGRWGGKDGDADWMDSAEPIFKGGWRGYLQWVESEKPGWFTKLEYKADASKGALGGAWMYLNALDADGLRNAQAVALG